MGRLDERTVVITGAGHGIGKALCLGLAREGASVAVSDISLAAAEAVADEISRGGGTAHALVGDVTDVESIRRLFADAEARFGGIDVLINNAGAWLRPRTVGFKPFEQIEIDEWDWVVSVNLRGTFLCCREVLPYLKRRGKGKILNMASATVFQGTAGLAHYVASKAGVLGLSRTLARDLGQYNIQVNSLSPGAILTDDNPSDEVVAFHNALLQRRSLKRIAYAEDLVGAALFFASDDSDFITGQTLVVDGGSYTH
jgi:3-oxoacyl-[acyl-carrier protein] reductase